MKKIKRGSLLGVSKLEKFDTQSIFNLKNKKIIAKNKKFRSRHKLNKEFYLDGSFYISDVKTFIDKKVLFITIRLVINLKNTKISK